MSKCASLLKVGDIVFHNHKTKVIETRVHQPISNVEYILFTDGSFVVLESHEHIELCEEVIA